MNKNQRNLTEMENKILELLLSVDFPGKSALLEQVKNCTVRTIDEEGSLEFFVNGGQKAPVIRRIPIEAQVKDTNGIYIHILLHVVDGYLKELEFYKEAGSQINKEIDLDKMELVEI